MDSSCNSGKILGASTASFNVPDAKRLLVDKPCGANADALRARAFGFGSNMATVVDTRIAPWPRRDLLASVSHGVDPNGLHYCTESFCMQENMEIDASTFASVKRPLLLDDPRGVKRMRLFFNL